jgi:4-hydroxythreonine-4-phosphate dehydrogenase
MLELCTPVIFANVKLLSFVKKSFQSDYYTELISWTNCSGKINVLNVWKEGVDLNFVGDPKA